MTATKTRRLQALLMITGAALLAVLLTLPLAAQAQGGAAAPSNLTARIVDGGVELNWEAPGENTGAVTGYQVLRRNPREDAVGVFETVVDDTGDTATSYTDTSATEAGNSYTYRVKARRGEELSVWSNYVRVNLPDEPEATSTPQPTATASPTPAPTATATPSPTPTATPAPENPLTGFTLKDASDQSTLDSLTDGASVELDDPDGGSYAVQANTKSGTAIGSVLIELAGTKSESRTENVAPYSLYGDGGATALTGGTMPAGSYTLTATAYSQKRGAGSELGTLSVSFTVTGQEAEQATPDPTPTATPTPAPTAVPDPTPTATQEPAATPVPEPTPAPSAQQNTQDTVHLAAERETVNEGDDIVLTVTMSREYTHEVSFSLSLNYTAGILDEEGFQVKTLHGYSVGYKTLQFPAGTTAQTLTIPTTEDETNGEDDRIIANLITSASSPPGKAVPKLVYVTVKEDDRPPGVPRNFRATNNVFNKIIYTWDPPSEEDGGPATSYEITGTDYYLNSDDYWWWDIGDATTFTYHTVESGTSFGHAVRAVNKYGTSFFTRTSGSADGLPWAPDLIINEGDGKLTVHLDPWGCDVDWHLIDEYRVQWKSGDRDFDSSRQITVATDSESGGSGVAPVVITGLENGTEYTVRAQTRNEHGGSGWTVQGGLIPGVDRPQTPLPEDPVVISSD